MIPNSGLPARSAVPRSETSIKPNIHRRLSAPRAGDNGCGANVHATACGEVPAGNHPGPERPLFLQPPLPAPPLQGNDLGQEKKKEQSEQSGRRVCIKQSPSKTGETKMMAEERKAHDEIGGNSGYHRATRPTLPNIHSQLPPSTRGPRFCSKSRPGSRIYLRHPG